MAINPEQNAPAREMILKADELLKRSGITKLAEADVEAWNATRNLGAQPMPEVTLLGWVEPDTGTLINEFYIPSNESDVVGEYRKATIYYDKTGIYDFFIVDHAGDEIWTPDIERARQVIEKNLRS